MANTRSWLLVVGVAAVGCSDGTSPPTNMFQAQLTGARTESLFGVALAERTFTEEFPDLHFVIRMPVQRGDTLQTIAIRCFGDQPPPRGSHAIDLSGEECVATYSRVLLTATLAVLERVDAEVGTLTIETANVGQVVGTFTFRGTMMTGAVSAGLLSSSGHFSAEWK